LIVTEYSFVAVAEAASVTRTVKVEEPAAVGVPLKTPPADRSSPAGRVPADTDQLFVPVPPVAVSVWLYAVPTVPAGSEAGEIVIPAAAFTVIVTVAVVLLRLPSRAWYVKVTDPLAMDGVKVKPPFELRLNVPLEGEGPATSTAVSGLPCASVSLARTPVAAGTVRVVPAVTL
jgi:hypothetical protein